MTARIVIGLLTSLVMATSLAGTGAQEARLWKSLSGDFSVIGALDVNRTFDASNKDQNVYITDPAGVEFQCRLDQLSAADRVYFNMALDVVSKGEDVGEALAWAPDERRKPGARRVLEVNGVKYAFRWIPQGSYVEPQETYDPNTLKAVAAAKATNKTKQKTVRKSAGPGFWMLETEATVEMYQSFVKAEKYRAKATKGRKLGYVGEPPRDAGVKPDEECSWQNPGFNQTKAHPVTLVTRRDVAAFCKWLSGELGKNVTLPTTAQWLRASQPESDPSSDYSALLAEWALGASENWERGNLPDANFPVICPIQSTVMSRINFTYRDSYRFTVPVGTFKPNDFGLYDMVGNVGEMSLDGTDVVESLGGSWFHLQNFNPINWKYVGSGLASETLDRAVNDYARSATESVYAQQYGGRTASGYGQNSRTTSTVANSSKPFIYSPIPDIDATCFTGFRVIILP